MNQSQNGKTNAMQFIQTAMLLLLMPGVGYIAKTTLENSRVLARMEESISVQVKLHDQLDAELNRLRDGQAGLEHRVTVVEGKILIKQ
jgi:hypothetical protein